MELLRLNDGAFSFHDRLFFSGAFSLIGNPSILPSEHGGNVLLRNAILFLIEKSLDSFSSYSPPILVKQEYFK
jgi:hypothetical protein